MFTFEVEGIKLGIELSSHAQLRMEEREVTSYQLYGAIVMLGEEILDMKNKEEFAIIDKELNASYVCAIHTDGMDITVDVITVIDTHRIYQKKGTKLITLN